MLHGSVSLKLAGVVLGIILFLLLAFNVDAKSVNCTVLPSSAAVPLTTGEKQLLTLLNSYRVSQGVKPLKQANLLSQAAAWKSRDEQLLASGLSHTDSLGRTPGQLLKDCGWPTGKAMGENLAAGYSTPTAVFNAWKASPGHNTNMLRPQFTRVGIALEVNTKAHYKWYWTLELARD